MEYTDTKHFVETRIDALKRNGNLIGKTDSNNAAWSWSKGKRYRVDFHIDYQKYNSGTWYWLTFKGTKFGIGQKRNYGTLNEALMIADLWAALNFNSTSYYGKIYTPNIYVIDTETNKVISHIDLNK